MPLRGLVSFAHALRSALSICYNPGRVFFFLTLITQSTSGEYKCIQHPDEVSVTNKGAITTTTHFHNPQLGGSYATRQASGAWKNLINAIVDVQGCQVANIGCGDGIYAKALLEMGAAGLTCIDSSETMLSDARSMLKAYQNASFLQGDALHTGANDQQFNVVLERALIHHIQPEDLQACFTEAYRILKPGSTLIVQDRTLEDCQLPGSQTHIQGYFFARYPRLLEKEAVLRHTHASVQQALYAAGFRVVEKRQLWEARRLYTEFEALAENLRARTGRSILYELNDDELKDLIEYIRQQLESDTQAIIEQDRWTIWNALR